MVLLRPKLWAVAAGLSLLGRGEGAAKNHRQPQTTTEITAPLPAPTGVSTATPVFFETSWPDLEQDNQIFYRYQQSFNLNYQLPKDAPDEIINNPQNPLTLVLLWTTAAAGQLPDSNNTWSLTNITYECDQNMNLQTACSFLGGAKGEAHLNLMENTAATQNIPETAGQGSKDSGFFLCFTPNVNSDLDTFTCESYSDFFHITNGSSSSPQHPRAEILYGRQNSFPQKPTAIMSVTQITDFLIPAASAVSQLNPSSTSASASSASTSYVIETNPITGTVTLPPDSSATAPVNASSSSKNKSSSLGTGPIIGIAVAGAGALAVLAIIAFFCRRRRQNRNKSRPEQVLLTHNMSRDLAIEKASPSDSAGPMLSSILETRPSSGPYDHLEASAPYNGPAGKRTTLQAHTELTRALSNASLGGPISPRSTRSMRERGHNLGAYDDVTEPYTDVPIYGDARHVPQVYTTMQAPFLHEPGMTDEELSRLEEEERRIDAAIAEAEAGRRR